MGDTHNRLDSNDLATRPETSLPLFRDMAVSDPNQCTSAVMAEETGEIVGGHGAGSLISSRPDIAHARNSDGKHSHEAAKSVSLTNLGRTKERIMDILRKFGPLTDEQISDKFIERYGEKQASPSGLRSRRSWLKGMGFVVEAGEGVTASGRKCSIWRLK